MSLRTAHSASASNGHIVHCTGTQYTFFCFLVYDEKAVFFITPKCSNVSLIVAHCGLKNKKKNVHALSIRVFNTWTVYFFFVIIPHRLLTQRQWKRAHPIAIKSILFVLLWLLVSRSHSDLLVIRVFRKAFFGTSIPHLLFSFTIHVCVVN